MDTQMAMFFEKHNPQKLHLLEEQDQNLKKQMTLNALIIKTYEFNNKVERGDKDDKHKGK